MKHRRAISVIAMVMLLAGLAVAPVSAQPPPMPCSFEGTVTLDGAACPDSIITVQLADGTPVATLPEVVTVFADSTYFMVVPQDVDTSLPAEGDTLNFYVDGNLGGSGTWNAGGIKTLDLAATTGAVTRYTLTVSVSPAGSGSVDLDPSQPAEGYIADTVVTLTATPASADWEFDHWVGDVSCTTCSHPTITMDADKTVTAYFESTVAPPPAETFADWLYSTFIA